MKFRTVVFLFIIAVILIAAFTKPGPDAFKEYYGAKNGLNTPPSIEYTNGVAYSVFSVTTFTIISEGGKQKAIAAPKSKYLGLFGRFWKL